MVGFELTIAKVNSCDNLIHTFINSEHFPITPLGVNCHSNDSETRISVPMT